MSNNVGTISGLRRFEAVTPTDGTTIEETRAILIETTGPVRVRGEGDAAPVTIPVLVGGVWHPMRVVEILDTGTTATTVYAGR